MAEIQKNSILYIIFPPGAGGNHLSNLFSLHDAFLKNNNWVTGIENPLNQEEYLFKKYKGRSIISAFNNVIGINAHFTEIPDIYKKQFIEYKTDLIKIYAGHYAILHNSKNLGVTDSTIFKVLLMTNPNENSWINKRYLNHKIGDSDYPEKYTIDGFLNPLTLGRFPVIDEWASTIDPNKIISVNTDEFLKPTGIEYLEQTTGIILPESAKTIHLLYLSWFNHLRQG